MGLSRTLIYTSELILCFTSQYSLFGNIECLKAVRLAGKSRDLLLLSFKDAKVFSS